MPFAFISGLNSSIRFPQSVFGSAETVNLAGANLGSCLSHTHTHEIHSNTLLD